jgi:MFS family permease
VTTSSEFRRGWRVLVASSVGVGCGINLNQYVGSLFVKELQGEFNWTRGQIAQAQGALLLSLILAPFIGRLIDLWGVRRIALGSSLLLACIYGGFAGIGGDINWYYALFAGQIVLGSGTGPIAYTRAVNTWFEKSRGLALGLTLMGVSVMGIAAPPALTAVIANFGWRAGYLAMAALLICFAAPIVYLGLYERADHMRRAGLIEAAANAERQAKTGYTVMEALRRPQFYILLFCILIMTIGLVAVISQLFPILTDKGLSKPSAALLISALALSVMVGRLVVGYLFDRFWAPLPAAIALSLPAIGAWLLTGPSPDLMILVPAVILIGFAQGAEVDVAAYFIARYFGLRAYASIYALIGIGFGGGTAIGAIAAGQLFDRFGNYETMLLCAAGSFLFAGAIILCMGRYPSLPSDEPLSDGQ